MLFRSPGAEELNLKLTAKASNNKSCDLVPMKEILNLTGYIRGGCSPLGMKKKYPIFVHRSVELHSFVYISAGVRGMQIKISPKDLIVCCNASMCNLI